MELKPSKHSLRSRRREKCKPSNVEVITKSESEDVDELQQTEDIDIVEHLIIDKEDPDKIDEAEESTSNVASIRSSISFSMKFLPRFISIDGKKQRVAECQSCFKLLKNTGHKRLALHRLELWNNNIF